VADLRYLATAVDPQIAERRPDGSIVIPKTYTTDETLEHTKLGLAHAEAKLEKFRADLEQRPMAALLPFQGSAIPGIETLDAHQRSSWHAQIAAAHTALEGDVDSRKQEVERLERLQAEEHPARVPHVGNEVGNMPGSSVRLENAAREDETESDQSMTPCQFLYGTDECDVVKLDLEYLLRHHLTKWNSASVGGIGSRLLTTLGHCRQSLSLVNDARVPLQVPVYSGMTEVQCVPFSLVIRGAALAEKKLAASDTGELLRKAAWGTAKSLLMGTNEQDALKWNQVGKQLYSKVGEISRSKIGMVDNMYNFWGLKGKLQEAARQAPVGNLLDSAPVIDELRRGAYARAGTILPQGSIALHRNRAWHFYRIFALAAEHGLPYPKAKGSKKRVEKSLNRAVEYLAELGQGAGAIDTILFMDFTKKLVEVSTRIAVETECFARKEKCSLDDVYREYCRENPEGPLGPLDAPSTGMADYAKCISDVRAVDALRVFSFFFLDQLKDVVTSQYAPVCGSAAKRTEVFSFDPDTEGGLCPITGGCPRGETPFCYADRARPACCAAEECLQVDVETSEAAYHAAAKHPLAWTAHGMPPNALAARHLAYQVNASWPAVDSEGLSTMTKEQARFEGKSGGRYMFHADGTYSDDHRDASKDHWQLAQYYTRKASLRLPASTCSSRRLANYATDVFVVIAANESHV
jgi:hypothetical protein